eukprot:1005296-Pleurochrysis_carterae.AAC.1
MARSPVEIMASNFYIQIWRGVIYGDTAIYYGAVRSGRQGDPAWTTHAFIWRVPCKLIYYGI